MPGLKLTHVGKKASDDVIPNGQGKLRKSGGEC